ncbi:MAG: hypothetical protein JXA13_01265 [Anaerolineales bacterium]|nr:hypothetical protein [Anaerolineales bacterium]
MNRTSLLFVIVIGILLLSACSLGAPPAEAAPTPDLAALRTEVAMTVVAEIAALAPPPTATLAFTPTLEGSLTPGIVVEATSPPADTATPGPCDDSLFIADVNVYDLTVIQPGQDFIKTWRIKNIGACTWGAGYVVAYADYAYKMDGQAAAIDQVVEQGEEIEVSVQFKAPTESGEYLSAWRMVNPAGTPFGETFFVKIIVE